MTEYECMIQYNTQDNLGAGYSSAIDQFSLLTWSLVYIVTVRTTGSVTRSTLRLHFDWLNQTGFQTQLMTCG